MEDVLQKRVGFGPRVGACIIDAVFMIAICVAMSFIFGATGAAVGADASTSIDYLDKISITDDDFYNDDSLDSIVYEIGENGTITADGFMGAMMGALLGILIGALMYVLIEAFTGASLGKMILSLKAGTLDGKNGSVSLYMGRAALKHSALFPLIIILVIPATSGAMEIISDILGLVILIGCFFVFRQSKQSLHDQISKTAIYYKKDLS